MVSEWINYKKKRTALSYTLDKEKENNFNLIEKNVCAAYDRHNHLYKRH